MTEPARQTLSVEDVKDLLHAQRHQVAYRYAPPSPGSYEDKGGYWTLNPGRPDRRVGSFVVWIDGPKAGRWNDYATGDKGDLLDLIALSLGCSLKDAFREARSFLGLQADSPEDVARRKAAAERARAQRAEAERAARAEHAKRQKRAFALWLSGQERIGGTPVEAYLRAARGIDLARLGHQPKALRFHPQLNFNQTDPETGEVFRGQAPAMLALITDMAGNPVSCHRTWLALGPDGRWSKALLPKPKKVYGDYKGAAIRIWRGLGPRGGRGKSLSEAEPGSRVYLTEGIEDALSVAMLLPHARVMAAIANTNFANLRLPEAISEVVFVADQDAAPETRAVIDRARARGKRLGRPSIPDQQAQAVRNALAQGMGIRAAARATGTAITTVARIKKDIEQPDDEPEHDLPLRDLMASSRSIPVIETIPHRAPRRRQGQTVHGSCPSPSPHPAKRSMRWQGIMTVPPTATIV